jgi:hypothetical protein
VIFNSTDYHEVLLIPLSQPHGHGQTRQISRSCQRRNVHEKSIKISSRRSDRGSWSSFRRSRQTGHFSSRKWSLRLLGTEYSIICDDVCHKRVEIAPLPPFVLAAMAKIGDDGPSQRHNCSKSSRVPASCVLHAALLVLLETTRQGNTMNNQTPLAQISMTCNANTTSLLRTPRAFSYPRACYSSRLSQLCNPSISEL